MSIVLPWLPGARILDLFAGSGALGLEALSRGAAEAHFVESSQRVLRTLRANVESLEAQSEVHIHRKDALKFAGALSPREFDVAFADPPYGTGLAQQVVEIWKDNPFAAVLGVEHAAREEMPEGGNTRRYGDTAITFYGVD